MLTGRRVFAAEDVSDTLAFILTKEPDWKALPSETPPAITRLLRRCLQKDRARRLADIADARLELEDSIGEDSTSGSPQSPKPHRVTAAHRWLPWTISVACLAVTAAVAGTVYFQPPTDTVVYRSSIPLPGRLRNTPGQNVALSPDGRRLAFVIVDAAGRSQIWVRSLDSVTARPLDGTGDGRSPFWSPDGRWLAFVAGGKLKKIDPSGGTPITVRDSAVAGGT